MKIRCGKPSAICSARHRSRCKLVWGSCNYQEALGQIGITDEEEYLERLAIENAERS